MKRRHAAALGPAQIIVVAIFLAIPIGALYLIWAGSPVGNLGGSLLALDFLPNVIPDIIFNLLPYGWMSEDRFKLLAIVVDCVFPVFAWAAAGVFVAKRIRTRSISN